MECGVARRHEEGPPAGSPPRWVKTSPISIHKMRMVGNQTNFDDLMALGFTANEIPPSTMFS